MTLVVCPNGSLERPSCKRRGCPVCGPRWARDWQRVLAVNLDARGGAVCTIAITAPGTKGGLPWDDEYCIARGRRMPGHTHSGPRGCRVKRRELAEWCATLGWRWQKYRQAARLATKRELGYAPRLIEARVWEPQKRGAPHLHLVLPFATPAEKMAAWAFLGHLRRLAPEYGFGRVQRRKKGQGPDLQPLEGREAARYLADYLTGRNRSKKKKSTIRENIADPRLPRSLLWLTPKLTRETMVTMRTLRRARHLWAWADGRCELPVWTGLEEAVRAVVTYRTVYPNAPPGPLGRDVDTGYLLELARFGDAHDSRPLWFERDELADWSRRLTTWAFRKTAPPAPVAV